MELRQIQNFGRINYGQSTGCVLERWYGTWLCWTKLQRADCNPKEAILWGQHKCCLTSCWPARRSWKRFSKLYFAGGRKTFWIEENMSRTIGIRNSYGYCAMVLLTLINRLVWTARAAWDRQHLGSYQWRMIYKILVSSPALECNSCNSTPSGSNILPFYQLKLQQATRAIHNRAARWWIRVAFSKTCFKHISV